MTVALSECASAKSTFGGSRSKGPEHLGSETRCAVSEERACLPRAEHGIDSRTGFMIIGEVGKHGDDELILVEASVELPEHGPDDATP